MFNAVFQKVINNIRFQIPQSKKDGTTFKVTLTLGLVNFGYTPYKLSLGSHASVSNDIWFDQLKNKPIIFCPPGVVVDEVNYRFLIMYQKEVGIIVSIITEEDERFIKEHSYKEIIEKYEPVSKLLLNYLEFNIHEKLQQDYFCGHRTFEEEAL